MKHMHRICAFECYQENLEYDRLHKARLLEFTENRTKANTVIEKNSYNRGILARMLHLEKEISACVEENGGI